MNESYFQRYVQRYFPKLQTLIEKVNGKRNKTLTYLFKEMLRMEYSPDQKWSSAAVDSKYVSADMVAMDSPLPLKKRPKLAESNGTLPKIGMEKVMGESMINTLNIMQAQADTAKDGDRRKSIINTIIAKLSNDAVACAIGIDEANEANFLSGLSNGAVLVEDDKNTGVGFRADYNYLDENIFGVTSKGSVTISDMKKVFDKANADGVSIEEIAIAKTTYDALRQTEEAKELVAGYRGIPYTQGDELPVPTPSAFDEAFADEYSGIKFLKIDRTVYYEKDGKWKSYKPWNADRVVYLPSHQIGALVYGTLAEDTNRVKYVDYQVVDSYKLISKYSDILPLREITYGQALALPVLEDVDSIYVTDKSVAGLAVSTDTLSLAATATSQSVSVESDGDFTAVSDASWLTLTAADGTLTVKPTANTGNERNAIVTITTSKGFNATVKVTQAAKSETA